MQERRKITRRQADRELAGRMQQMETTGDSDMDKERRHLYRQAIRHNCTLQVAIRFKHTMGNSDVWSASEQGIKGKLQDLSDNGAMVVTEHQLEIGQELSLRVKLRTGGEVNAIGAVRWTKLVEHAKFFASGVQFTQLADSDGKRLRSFLTEMIKTVGF
jgi:hypothetical protein